jgi:hypothetical protein
MPDGLVVSLSIGPKESRESRELLLTLGDGASRLAGEFLDLADQNRLIPLLAFLSGVVRDPGPEIVRRRVSSPFARCS